MDRHDLDSITSLVRASGRVDHPTPCAAIHWLGDAVWIEWVDDAAGHIMEPHNTPCVLVDADREPSSIAYARWEEDTTACPL